MQSLQQHFGRLASHHAASTSGRASSHAMGALSSGAALGRPTHSAAAAASAKDGGARGSHIAARAAASPFRTLPSLPAGGLASLSLDVEPDMNALELRDVKVGTEPTGACAPEHGLSSLHACDHQRQSSCAPSTLPLWTAGCVVRQQAAHGCCRL